MIADQVKLTPEFKSQTNKAIFSIIFFVFVYSILLLSAVALTAICIYAGVAIILAVPRLIVIALGLGLASFGVLILVFLIKFIFKSHKVDRSHLVEVHKDNEPKLFELIDDIVKEVGTAFPKKVYLSSEVNASVFYDSSFWSMFFPVKKNLTIGLGLVNSVNKSELKAILSHEFGHFAQRSMKVGSYVYNVNQVIFNMIYDNSSFDKLIHKWSSVSGFFAIFVILAVKVIQGIQWILRKLYEVVNKSYLALSREMEFHADEIAAHITGYRPLQTSLVRLSLADHAFNTVLNYYDAKIAENIKSENVYQEQAFVMNFIAKDHDISILDNLPRVSVDDLNKFNKSKLVIKDQWSSHPSTEERVERLQQINLDKQDLDTAPASDYFENIDETQKKLTQHIFKNVKYEGETKFLSFQDFEKNYSTDYINNSFSKDYNGYYDNKNPLLFDLENIEENMNIESLKDLFSDEKVDLVYTANSLSNDIETLKQVANKTIRIKTFDYDGKRYKRKEAQDLINTLNRSLKDINQSIQENDISIYSYFLNIEKSTSKKPELTDLYRQFFKFDETYADKYEYYTRLINGLNFINYTTQIEEINLNFSRLKGLEAKVKMEIKAMLSDPLFKEEITPQIRENFELYCSKEWKYIGNTQYFEKNLNTLFTALHNYGFVLSRGYFLLKKKLLSYQIELLK
jgi:Zn-dependent protease with chaperone function